MEHIGFFVQFVAFITGIGAIACYGLSYRDGSGAMEKYGNYLLLAQVLFITVASIVLLVALVDGYYLMEYVAKYTDRKLPLIYKISGLWAGQAGSLLFWAWLASLFGGIELFRLRKSSGAYRTSVLLVTVLTSTFFLTLVCFVSEANPFAVVSGGLRDFVLANNDGLGMNPLLQNPGMLYHPPTLYLGFVGFTIPLGHAVGSMMTNDSSSFWVKDSRAWSIFSWIFLTIGIVLGGQWAYVELGWGGYWAWDPVENGSLIPWFTATAFLHSALAYERKGKLKVWSLILIMLSYELCIFGTYITRSGVLDSVHSFGASSLGYFLMIHMVGSIILFLVLFVKKLALYEEKDAQEFEFASKEGLFFISNWLFVGLAIVVLIGTMMPVITKMPIISNFFETSRTVGVPFYNRVSTPFFMAILILAGIAPHVSYSKPGKDDYTAKLVFPFVAMVAAMAGLYVFGYKKPIPLALFGFTTFSTVTILIQLIKPIMRSGLKAVKNAARYYSALIVHIGVILMAYGIIASSFYNIELEKVARPGETFEFKEYTMKVHDIIPQQRVNYQAVVAPVEIFKGDKKIVTLAPERRFYEKNDQVFGEVALRSTLAGDLYIIFANFDGPDVTRFEDLTATLLQIKVVYQPLIIWLWIGCAVMVLGGFIGFFDSFGSTGRRKDD